YSRVWAFSWLISVVFLLLVNRFTVAHLVTRWARAGLLTRNIVVVGAGRQGRQLLRHIEMLDEPWNWVVGVFDDRLSRVGKNVDGYPVLGNIDELADYGRTHRADDILVALPWSSEQRIHEVMRMLAALPSNVRLIPENIGSDLLNRRTTDQFGVPMLNLLEKPVPGWGAFSKALTDILFGVIFVLISLPIFLIIAFLIKRESKGPVFFKQKRYGFNNQLIEVYKFRTMYADQTDKDADKLTTRDDPRVTGVGAVLRRFSLDELPQLLNVVKGEMSLVGPRPHAMKAKAAGRLYEEVVDGYAVRHKVKPGITGWAQVNGWRGNTETEEAIEERVRHDLWYIENWSLLLDFYILLRTVGIVSSGENSY
ncbi:MAG: undecaprenyl-phosphate glucose phosphotransferase, partial [Gammaproteobacteria bacterium]